MKAEGPHTAPAMMSEAPDLQEVFADPVTAMCQKNNRRSRQRT